MLMKQRPWMGMSFSGGASCGRKTQQLAIQDAVGEAILKAMQMG